MTLPWMSSHSTLTPQIFERPLTHDIALDVLALNVLVWPEGLLLSIPLELFIESDCILNLCDLLEVSCVWDLQASHAKGMSPFLEVAFECSAPPVRVVPTDFALVLNAQTMKLVQPERDWFSIPSEWQVQRIVDWPLLLFFATKI